MEKDIFRKNISHSREIWFTRLGLAITLTASVLLFCEIGQIVRGALQSGNYAGIFEEAVFFVLVVILIYGNVLYQLTRKAYYRRLSKHSPAPLASLDFWYDRADLPLCTVLIPSYKEEERVIRQSLLSCALQSYPNKRIVLLVDDPPLPSTQQDYEILAASRRLPLEISELLAAPMRKFRNELEEFLSRRKSGPLDLWRENLVLMQRYTEVIKWFEFQKSAMPEADHSDRLFVQLTFDKRIREFEERIAGLDERLIFTSKLLGGAELELEYRRLSSLFKVEITSFERKVYENLSHEPNKAMNLNSYIGLMGRSFVETASRDRMFLEESAPEKAHRHFSLSDYVLTLDADSFLDPDYMLRLLSFMEDPKNAKTAVVQTPYSAIPGAPSPIERIAGATTDMQYIIHQGFTRHNATFWVGANALLRMKALQEIREEDIERGHKIYRFIQDRTVIEDTESSVDLIAKGWALHNFPERLSYSATPPDFGALLIQRRRWANGGLIILPKLIRHFRAVKKTRAVLSEFFMRFHYLASIAGVNFGLMLLLLCPFKENMKSLWLPLTAAPYYFLYGRDLVLSGYRKRDLYGVYALNMMLIPINLGGVFKSIHQAISARKIPFGRTPKVLGRTAAPAFYCIAEAGLLFLAFAGFVTDCWTYNWAHAGFSFFTAVTFAYAIARFIGWREMYEDVTGRPTPPEIEKIPVDSGFPRVPAAKSA